MLNRPHSSRVRPVWVRRHCRAVCSIPGPSTRNSGALVGVRLVRQNRAGQWTFLAGLEPALARIASQTPLLGIKLLWMAVSPDDEREEMAHFEELGAAVEIMGNAGDPTSTLARGPYDVMVFSHVVPDDLRDRRFIHSLVSAFDPNRIVVYEPRRSEAITLSPPLFAVAADASDLPALVLDATGRSARFQRLDDRKLRVLNLLPSLGVGRAHAIRLLDDYPDKLGLALIGPKSQLSFVNYLKVIQAYAGSGVNQLFLVQNAELRVAEAILAPETVGSDYQVASWDGLIGRAAKNGKIVWVPEVDRDREYIPAEPGTRSELALPLRAQSEAPVLGVVNVELDRVDALTESDIEWLRFFCLPLGQMISNMGIASPARPYRKIYACYTHKDHVIVEQFMRYVKAFGDRYLRDVSDLRAGEAWDGASMKLIEEADVFQLFWSTNAAASPFVRRELEYALSLNRANFVRPVYWEDPLPEFGMPEDLRRIHFARITLPLAPEGYDLLLMSSVEDVSGIPAEGKKLVIVAAVENRLRFRIFDDQGRVVVDTDDTALKERAREIEDFRKQLERLWPPHELTGSEKERVVTTVTSIVGRTHPKEAEVDDGGIPPEPDPLDADQGSDPEVRTTESLSPRGEGSSVSMEARSNLEITSHVHATGKMYEEFVNVHNPNLFNYVVLIIHENVDAGEENVGSGVMVGMDGRHFIATAAHCMKRNPRVIINDDFYVATNGKIVVNHPVRILRRWSHPDLDIGFLEVGKSLGTEMGEGQLFSGPILGGFLHVVGHPTSRIEVNEPQKEITLVKSVFSTVITERTDDSLKLEYPKTGFRFEGDQWIEEPFIETPKGFSGGGCFGVSNEGGDVSVIGYKLVGIQSAWHPTERWVEVVPIRHWLDGVKSQYG